LFKGKRKARFFLVKNNRKIEDIQSIYPTQLIKLLFAKKEEFIKFVDGANGRNLTNNNFASSVGYSANIIE